MSQENQPTPSTSEKNPDAYATWKANMCVAIHAAAFARYFHEYFERAGLPEPEQILNFDGDAATQAELWLEAFENSGLPNYPTYLKKAVK